MNVQVDKSIKKSISFMSKRPKRCYVCKKFINPQKYDSHFQECSKFEKGKIDKQRERIKFFVPKKQRTSIKQLIETNPPVLRNSLRKPNNNQFNSSIRNNFRIKNVSGISTFKKEILEQKNIEKNKLSRQTQFDQKKILEPETKIVQKMDPKQFTSSIQTNDNINFNLQQANIQSNRRNQFLTEKKQSIQQQKNEIKICENQFKHVYHKNEEENPQIFERLQQKQKLNYFSQEQQTTSQADRIQSQNIVQNDADNIFAQNQTFRNIVSQEINQQPIALNDTQPRGNIEYIPSNVQNNRSSPFRDMVNLTNQIITFINRVGLQRDETLSMMVEQLMHVNQISQQIQELNQIGNSLGFTMETLFGNRIQELQNVILTQVSMAVLRSLNQQMSSEFQVFLQRNPQLRKGFTNDQIQDNFKEINFSQPGQCSICLMQVQKNDKIIKLQCNHYFHPDCIKKWLQNSKNCPMCRHQQKIN